VTRASSAARPEFTTSSSVAERAHGSRQSDKNVSGVMEGTARLIAHSSLAEEQPDRTAHDDTIDRTFAPVPPHGEALRAALEQLDRQTGSVSPRREAITIEAAARRHTMRIMQLIGDHHPADHRLGAIATRLVSAVDAIDCVCSSGGPYGDPQHDAVVHARAILSQLVDATPRGNGDTVRGPRGRRRTYLVAGAAATIDSAHCGGQAWHAASTSHLLATNDPACHGHATRHLVRAAGDPSGTDAARTAG
jgi:hypothetical protein